MRKQLLILSTMMFMVGVPFMNAQDINRPAIENEVLPVTITVYESTIHIKNAQQQTLQIYDVTGKCVASYKIDSSDKVISATLPRGCYILKIGRIARKVYLH